VGISAVVYFASATILKVSEASEALAMITRKLGR
jgi:hypothetical protein